MSFPNTAQNAENLTPSGKLIQEGDCFFEKEDYENAFKYYHGAHMLGDFWGTYKLAECFRIAFLAQNINDVNIRNHIEYAHHAIDLYSISYAKLKEDNILSRKQFLEFLLDLNNKPYKSKKYTLGEAFGVWGDGVFDWFVFKRKKLIQLIGDVHAERLLRIFSAIVNYKLCWQNPDFFLGSEIVLIKENLKKANKLGAKFNVDLLVSSLNNRIEEWEKQKKNHTGEEVIFPNWYYGMRSAPYEDGGCYEESYEPNSDDGPDDNYDEYYNDDYDGYNYEEGVQDDDIVF